MRSDDAAVALSFIESAGGGTQRRHSTVLSDSSSDSARALDDSSSATEFLKGEMWGKSKIPSSSTFMMGMSRLQRESGRAETQTGCEEREIKRCRCGYKQVAE